MGILRFIEKSEGLRMDVFDKYLFEEITNDYDKDDLSTEDYGEIYQRFLNLEHIPEVKPYILAMKFLGYGTKTDEEYVLKELEKCMADNDISLLGLYYDCLLYKNRDDEEAAIKLNELVDKGYSDIYLKEHSHVNYDEEYECDYIINCGNCGCEFGITEEENEQEGIICPSCKKVIILDEVEDVDKNEDEDYDDDEKYKDGDIEFKKIEFESNGITGIYFTSNNVDYMHAVVFFEPVEEDCHISVRSQIFVWNNPESDVIEDEIDLKKGDYSFNTTGWGNKSFNCYSSGWYKWVVEINGDDTYSREFCICDGKMQNANLHIDHVKMFASGIAGAREEDMNYCTTNFSRETLEHIYFMAEMETEPGANMYVPFFIKVIYLEANKVVFDECIMQSLDADTYACWKSVGYPIPNYWNKGLYKYIVKLGNSNEYEGNFTVY